MRPNTLFKPICLLILGALVLVPGRADADEVTDWNTVLLRAIQTAATPGAKIGRSSNLNCGREMISAAMAGGVGRSDVHDIRRLRRQFNLSLRAQAGRAGHELTPG